MWPFLKTNLQKKLDSMAPKKNAFYKPPSQTPRPKSLGMSERNAQRSWAVLFILKEHASNKMIMWPFLKTNLNSFSAI
jgi:hypothetical protein